MPVCLSGDTRALSCQEPHERSPGVENLSTTVRSSVKKKMKNKSTVVLSRARIQGRRWGRRPPLGRKDPRRRRGFPRLKGKKKGHWRLLNGCSTPFRHNMAIKILKSCKSVFAYVKNRSFPSHIRSLFPWRPPLAEILDPHLLSRKKIFTTRMLPLLFVRHVHTEYQDT